MAIVDGNKNFDRPGNCNNTGYNDEKSGDVLAEDIKGSAGVRCCNDAGVGASVCNYVCEHVSYPTAQTRCSDIDMRLCTVSEVLALIPAKTGCWYDISYVWTSDVVACDSGGPKWPVP